MELTVNGTRVVLRDKLSAKANWDLLQKAQTFSGGTATFEDMVEIVRRYVKEWDFPGDPADPASYEDLDLFKELLPIVNAAIGAQEQGPQSAKNSR